MQEKSTSFITDKKWFLKRTHNLFIEAERGVLSGKNTKYCNRK